jgi:hypothetical protein
LNPTPKYLISPFYSSILSACSEVFPSSTVTPCYFYLAKKLWQMARDFGLREEGREIIEELKVLALGEEKGVRERFEKVRKEGKQKFGRLLDEFNRRFMRDDVDDEERRGFANVFPIKMWNFGYYKKKPQFWTIVNSYAERFADIQKKFFSMKQISLKRLVEGIRECEDYMRAFYQKSPRASIEWLPKSLNNSEWAQFVGEETAFCLRYISYSKPPTQSPYKKFYISGDEDFSDKEEAEKPISVPSQTECGRKQTWRDTKLVGFKEYKRRLMEMKRIKFNRVSYQTDGPKEREIWVGDAEESVMEVSRIDNANAFDVWTIVTKDEEDNSMSSKKSKKSVVDVEMEDESSAWSDVDEEVLAKNDVDNKEKKSESKHSANSSLSEEPIVDKSSLTPMQKISKILASHNLNNFLKTLTMHNVSNCTAPKLTLKELRSLGLPLPPARQIIQALHSSNMPDFASQESICQTLDAYKYSISRKNAENSPLKALKKQYKLRKERFIEKVCFNRYKRRRDNKAIRKLIQETSKNSRKGYEQKIEVINPEVESESLATKVYCKAIEAERKSEYQRNKDMEVSVRWSSVNGHSQVSEMEERVVEGDHPGFFSDENSKTDTKITENSTKEIELMKDEPQIWSQTISKTPELIAAPQSEVINPPKCSEKQWSLQKDISDSSSIYPKPLSKIVLAKSPLKKRTKAPPKPKLSSFIKIKTNPSPSLPLTKHTSTQNPASNDRNKFDHNKSDHNKSDHSKFDHNKSDQYKSDHNKSDQTLQKLSKITTQILSSPSLTSLQQKVDTMNAERKPVSEKLMERMQRFVKEVKEAKPREYVVRNMDKYHRPFEMNFEKGNTNNKYSLYKRRRTPQKAKFEHKLQTESQIETGSHIETESQIESESEA